MNPIDYEALDENEVAACPDCDASGVIMNTTNDFKRVSMGDTPRYRCRRCDATFEEYVRREKERAGAPTRGLAAALDAADPDEVSR